ncbi:MAG: DNA repair protein RadA, partial [uncultured Actinomycetospora sp.]
MTSGPPRPAVTARAPGRPGPTRVGPARGKDRPGHACTECGATVAKWVGQCPQCSAWGTIAEVAPVRALPGLKTSVQGEAPQHP